MKSFMHFLVAVPVILCLFAPFSFASPVVLFDESHAQQFLIGSNRALDLSRLAESYRALGFKVLDHKEKLSADVLSRVDVLIISGAFKPLGSDERQAVLDFVAKGGGLAVMLHIAPPLKDLLHTLDVDFSNGTLRETSGLIKGNPLDFTVRNFLPHPVTDGLSSFSIYGSWALRSTASHVSIIAETSQHGWVDLDRNKRLSVNDAVQKFGIMAAGRLGSGRYVVLGDDAVFQNQFFDQRNRQLATRIVEWLSFK